MKNLTKIKETKPAGAEEITGRSRAPLHNGAKGVTMVLGCEWGAAHRRPSAPDAAALRPAASPRAPVERVAGSAEASARGLAEGPRGRSA